MIGPLLAFLVGYGFYALDVSMAFYRLPSVDIICQRKLPEIRSGTLIISGIRDDHNGGSHKTYHFSTS